jgi:hypothetical protein
MKKTLILTIIIDDINLKELEEVSEKVEDVFKDYKFKRIDMNLSDTSMVKPSFQPPGS